MVRESIGYPTIRSLIEECFFKNVGILLGNVFKTWWGTETKTICLFCFVLFCLFISNFPLRFVSLILTSSSHLMICDELDIQARNLGVILDSYLFLKC